jgi:signal transduction histidine kinase/ActR/RegA family two-component response regulator
MTWFEQLPIRRKLLVMTLAATATALVLATAGFLAWDISQYRSEIRQDVDAQATIVADNSTAALAFLDHQAAGETLSVLRLRPRVQFACLYDAERGLFATYHRDAGMACPSRPPETGQVFDANSYRVTTPVTQGRQLLGVLFIQRELGDLYTRLRIGILTLAGLLLASVLVTLLVVTRLQQLIALPLLRLADTARAISAGRDYSLRAARAADDEIGVVVTAFNDMLDRLAEGNAELSRTNTELAREVDERRRVEIERTAALERERDANRLKDEFLATLSHELRTPLNAVMGWTRVLRAAQVEPETQARALESIERNAHAQARLIEDLLEISRIVTGKLRIQVQDIDLAAIVDAALEVVQPAARARSVRLVAEITVRPARTSGDPDRLQQIVWNLLSNAVKFTPEGGEVIVRLVRDIGYRLTVRDTGQGIEPRFLPFAFEPFRQADGTSSREHGGLGLGLAIARQLVELHGGSIDASSPGRGRGSTFTVYLPSVLSPPAPEPRPAATSRFTPTSDVDPSLLHHFEILVVDDQEDARALLSTTLAQYGAHVMTADSAQAALAQIANQVPDILLSDIGMPREDGYTLIRQLRAMPPHRGGTVPAIAITAYASAADQRAALAAGYQAHIAKPFDAVELTTLVARLARTTASR